MLVELKKIEYPSQAGDQGLHLLERWWKLVKYHFLLQNIVIRDLNAHYKNSLLGVLWSLLNPLASLLSNLVNFLFTFVVLAAFLFIYDLDVPINVWWGTVGSNGSVSMDPIFILGTFMTSIVIFIIGYGVFLRFEHLFGEKL